PVLAHDVGGQAAPLLRHDQVPVVLDAEQPVALHPRHGLAHGGAALLEALGDAGPKRHDAFLFKLENRAEVQLRGVDEPVRGQRSPPLVGRRAFAAAELPTPAGRVGFPTRTPRPRPPSVPPSPGPRRPRKEATGGPHHSVTNGTPGRLSGPLPQATRAARGAPAAPRGARPAAPAPGIGGCPVQGASRSISQPPPAGSAEVIR